MNKIKLYNKIREVYEDLEYLVEPFVIEDVRSQRRKLKIIMKELEEKDLDMLRDMLKDIPDSLALEGLNLSALSECLRKEIISDIDNQLKETEFA